MTAGFIDGDLVIAPRGPARVRLVWAAVDGRLSKPGQWCVIEYSDDGQTAIVHADELALARREPRHDVRREQG